MALIPVRCPGCGASVDLQEGQSLAKCTYCGETSSLLLDEFGKGVSRTIRYDRNGTCYRAVLMRS